MTQKNYTKSELALLYNWSYSKFYQALKTMKFYEVFEASKYDNYITPKQLSFIIDNIGELPMPDTTN